MELFESAVVYAAKMHDGARRKGSDRPYLFHPLEVALIVSGMTSDPEVLAAAVLHDTVEDTSASIDEIRELFGGRVAALVASETENKRPGVLKADSWRVRKEESLLKLENAEDDGVRFIWLADKLANIRSLKKRIETCGSSAWKIFNCTDPKQHEWYYRSIARLTSQLYRYDAYREFCELIDKTFEGEADGTDEI